QEAERRSRDPGAARQQRRAAREPDERADAPDPTEAGVERARDDVPAQRGPQRDSARLGPLQQNPEHADEDPEHHRGRQEQTKSRGKSAVESAAQPLVAAPRREEGEKTARKRPDQ